jgi:fucose 4-O-acetylase-like acetyltransferase
MAGRGDFEEAVSTDVCPSEAYDSRVVVFWVLGVQAWLTGVTGAQAFRFKCKIVEEHVDKVGRVTLILLLVGGFLMRLVFTTVDCVSERSRTMSVAYEIYFWFPVSLTSLILVVILFKKLGNGVSPRQEEQEGEEGQVP